MKMSLGGLSALTDKRDDASEDKREDYPTNEIPIERFIRPKSSANRTRRMRAKSRLIGCMSPCCDDEECVDVAIQHVTTPKVTPKPEIEFNFKLVPYTFDLCPEVKTEDQGGPNYAEVDQPIRSGSHSEATSASCVREANREGYPSTGDGLIGELVVEGRKTGDTCESRTEGPGSSKPASGPDKQREDERKVMNVRRGEVHSDATLSWETSGIGEDQDVQHAVADTTMRKKLLWNKRNNSVVITALKN